MKVKYDKPCDFCKKPQPQCGKCHMHNQFIPKNRKEIILDLLSDEVKDSFREHYRDYYEG